MTLVCCVLIVCVPGIRSFVLFMTIFAGTYLSYFGRAEYAFPFFFCAASFSRCTEADKGLAFCKYAPEIVRVGLVCAARAHVDVTCKS